MRISHDTGVRPTAHPSPQQAGSRSGCCSALAEPLSDGDAIDLASAFAALGDPVRLRLFSMIASAGTVCACDLVEPLGKSQPTVSHHTKVLSEAGLISGQKVGRWVHWTVVPAAIDRLRSALTPADR